MFIYDYLKIVRSINHRRRFHFAFDLFYRSYMRNKPSSAMLLLVPLGLLQLYVQPQTHIQDGHLIGGHALTAATFLSRKPLQFASSRTYTTRRSPIYPGSVYSTAYGLNPSFQPDYRPNIAYNTAGQNEVKLAATKAKSQQDCYIIQFRVNS